MSEMLFSMFFARRLQAKRCFWQFLHFAHKRRMIFCVFWLSKGWKMQPVAFFDFPKFGMADFCCFSVFPMLGRPFSSVFRSFQVWESRFSLFFCFPKFGVVEHHLLFHGTNENVFDFKALGIGYAVFIRRSHRYHQSRIR